MPLLTPKFSSSFKKLSWPSLKDLAQKTYSLHSIKSKFSIRSFLSAYSVFCIASLVSFLSVGSLTSALSLFSVNSILSVASVNSILSFGCTNRVLQICNNVDAVKNVSATVAQLPPEPELPFLIFASKNACFFGSCASANTCSLSGNMAIINESKYIISEENEELVQTSQFYASANVFYPTSAYITLDTGNGIFSLQTISSVIQYERVPESTWHKYLDLKLSEMVEVFDFRQIFALYAAELLSGHDKGFCRGGHSGYIEAFNVSNKIVLVPTRLVTEVTCDTYSHNTIKPASMPSCTPMKRCLENKACAKLFDDHIKNVNAPCAYTHGEYASLIAAPTVASALLISAAFV